MLHSRDCRRCCASSSEVCVKVMLLSFGVMWKKGNCIIISYIVMNYWIVIVLNHYRKKILRYEDIVSCVLCAHNEGDMWKVVHVAIVLDLLPCFHHLTTWYLLCWCSFVCHWLCAYSTYLLMNWLLFIIYCTINYQLISIINYCPYLEIFIFCFYVLCHFS